MAYSVPPNSTTLASRKRVAPARREVTCTGTRTGLTLGKKRANCSAQFCSFVVSVKLPDRPTSPLTLPAKNPSAFPRRDTPRAARDTDFRRQRCTPHAKEWKLQDCRKVQKKRGLGFSLEPPLAHSSQRETVSSHRSTRPQVPRNRFRDEWPVREPSPEGRYRGPRRSLSRQCCSASACDRAWPG